MIDTETELAYLVLKGSTYKGNEILCDGCWSRAQIIKQLALQIATDRGWDCALYLPEQHEEASDAV